MLKIKLIFAYIFPLLFLSSAPKNSTEAQTSLKMPVAFSYGKLLEKSELFLDKRDGKKYKKIKIGSQVWMAENLNFGKLVFNLKQSNNQIPEKTYFKNDSLLGYKFGALYTWDEAVNYQNINSKIQGLCPDGWHIPSESEWHTLLKHLDKKIKAPTDGWQGETIGLILLDTNKCAMNIKLSGNAVSNWFFYLNEMSYFWCSTMFSKNSAKYIALDKKSTKVYSGYGDKQIGMSIRCIENQ